MATLTALTLSACARHHHEPMPAASSDAGDYSAAVQQGYTTARAATDKFHVLDSAVAVGYAATVAKCFADSTQGAMGFHHINRAYVDNRVEIERPEILLYERRANGSYVLNGVEYIIPFRVWPRDSVPPKLMGRDMLQSDELSLWYTHMWIWNKNSSGLFANYNPAVKCRD